MGHQIYAGEKKVSYTAGSRQVCEWCEPFDDRPFDHETQTDTNLPESVVAAANASVPLTYLEAREAGLVNEGIDEEGFEYLRDFLRYAADGGYDIHGSY